MTAIAVHGGAGPASGRGGECDDEHRAALAEAMRAGAAILDAGGRALDAVQSAVVALESCELYNAGRGSVLTEDGGAEMDAALMCGRSGRAGAVACVSRLEHPIEAARAVLEDGRHVFVCGDSAEDLARERGVEMVDPATLVTERQRARWRRWRAQDAAADTASRGTVGAVALDGRGELAAATSTGGTLGKRAGRIGDSPLIGAGTYASATCAVSCTGDGEAIIRAVAAHEVAAAIEHRGLSLAAAAARVVEEILADSQAGLIAVDARGRLALPFNTASMHRAWREPGGQVHTAVG